MVASARVFSLLMVLALFVSTALISITESLILILWFATWIMGKEKKIFLNSFYPPVVKVGAALLALILIQTIITPEKFSSALSHFGKYRELLLLPLLVFFLNNEQWKKIIYYSFLVGMTFILIHSYLQFFGLVAKSSGGIGAYTSSVGRIAGAIMLAFTSFAFLEEALRYKKTQLVWLGLGLFLASSFALLFFYNGRTGILIYSILFIVWGARFLGSKGILITSALMLIFSVLIYQSSEKVQERADQTQKQLTSLFNSEHPDDVKKIKGVVQEGVLSREVMYIRVFDLIKNRSAIQNIIGGGTGSLKYDSELKEYEVENPHNEYLLILYENGVLGLFLLMAFYVMAWLQSNHLAEHEKWLLRGLVITISIGSLVNSLLLDNKEAHFYVLLLAAFIPPIKHRQHDNLNEK